MVIHHHKTREKGVVMCIRGKNKINERCDSQTKFTHSKILFSLNFKISYNKIKTLKLIIILAD